MMFASKASRFRPDKFSIAKSKQDIHFPLLLPSLPPFHPQYIKLSRTFIFTHTPEGVWTFSRQTDLTPPRDQRNALTTKNLEEM